MKFWQMISYTELDQIIEVARFAEELGFEGVMGSEHVLYPKRMGSPYPYSEDGKLFIDGNTAYPDTWVTYAAISSVTSRLKFSTSVSILPLHNPIEVAKSAATLSILSQERFILGAGVGWMKEEYEILGIDFSTRGKRMDEMIEVLNRLWTDDGWTEYHGDHFNFDPIKVSPKPAARIPIYTGGSSKPALRRTARVADGWIGHGNEPGEVPGILKEISTLREQAGRDHLPFETVIGLTTPPDYDTFRRLEDDGMTSGVSYPFWFIFEGGSSLDEKKRYMENFAESFIQRL